MRKMVSLLVATTAATGCIASDESPDGIDEDAGIAAGKADGSLTECQLAAIVAYLNTAELTVEALEEAGVHSRASENLMKHRAGADGAVGTEDDDAFDTIEEVDAVPYVGRTALAQLVAATADRCTAGDIFTDARDVTLRKITFAPGTPAPTDYAYPEGGDFDLGGTEFWQKWSGGHNPTYSFEEGTDAGRLCMQASAIRFETIMREPPAELVALADSTNWDGSFFNWNDDYSNESAFGSASGPRLWAWRTYLIKWISQTGKNGECFLPTRDLVIRAATACQATAGGAMGEIQGCSASL
jgi:hypothetical protein